MIIVTGGSGKVGRACVKDLTAHGYNVTSIDMARPVGQSNPPKPGDVNFTRVDITDFGQVMSALSGINARVEEPVEAVVHLGAIASPGEAPDDVIFHTNATSTYNIFEACKRLGIKNIVWASSETMYGLPYEGGPAYVPVDEDLELPEWSYSLSKLMGEKMAEQYCRWDSETKIIGLRFSNVMEEADYARFEEYNEDPFARRFNLWTYIDARDAAQAVRKAMEAKITGVHVAGIANSNSLMRMGNDELLDLVYPGTKRKRPLEPNESLISIEKARTLFGYAPKHDWKK